MTDPYSVLGITPSADDETIKKAYRKKCKEYHPDLHPDDPSAEDRSGLGITAQAARPGGRVTAALPVTQSCVPRQTTSAAASMRRP